MSRWLMRIRAVVTGGRRSFEQPSLARSGEWGAARGLLSVVPLAIIGTHGLQVAAGTERRG